MSRRNDKWGSPLLRFTLVVIASVLLWTAIAFGLWSVVDALW